MYSLYLEVDWPLRWEWVRFPLMNSVVSDTFVLGSTMAITSCVPDPCQVAGDLSTRLTWRIPECLHVDNLDIPHDTCRWKGFLFGTLVSFIAILKDLASAETDTLCNETKAEETEKVTIMQINPGLLIPSIPANNYNHLVW